MLFGSAESGHKRLVHRAEDSINDENERIFRNIDMARLGAVVTQCDGVCGVRGSKGSGKIEEEIGRACHVLNVRDTAALVVPEGSHNVGSVRRRAKVGGQYAGEGHTALHIDRVGHSPRGAAMLRNRFRLRLALYGCKAYKNTKNAMCDIGIGMFHWRLLFDEFDRINITIDTYNSRVHT